MTTVPAHEGRRVIVTGGGAGIGRAIARAFLEEGARVHACDRDPTALEHLPGSTEDDLDGTVADVSSEADVVRLFEEAMDRLGGLDVLVNNAGTAGPTGPVETLDLDGWRRTLAVNLDGLFLCARAAVPALRRAGGGSIVNLSSTAGLHGYPLRSPYATAKWGVIGFTRTLAMELGPAGIRVNAICPGSVRGDRIDRVIAAQPPHRACPRTRSGRTGSGRSRSEPSSTPRMWPRSSSSSPPTQVRRSPGRRSPWTDTRRA